MNNITAGKKDAHTIKAIRKQLKSYLRDIVLRASFLGKYSNYLRFASEEYRARLENEFAAAASLVALESSTSVQLETCLNRLKGTLGAARLSSQINLYSIMVDGMFDATGSSHIHPCFLRSFYTELKRARKLIKIESSTAAELEGCSRSLAQAYNRVLSISECQQKVLSKIKTTSTKNFMSRFILLTAVPFSLTFIVSMLPIIVDMAINLGPGGLSERPRKRARLLLAGCAIVAILVCTCFGSYFGYGGLVFISSLFGLAMALAIMLREGVL